MAPCWRQWRWVRGGRTTTQLPGAPSPHAASHVLGIGSLRSLRSALPRTTKPQDRPKKKTRTEKGEGAARPARGQPEETAEASDRGEESGPSEADETTSEGGGGDDAPADGEAYPDVVDDGASPLPRGKARETSEASSIERFDPLSAYLREVQRHRLLSPEETQGLAEKFVKTQDSAAAARLVTSNLRLVVKIAYEYRRAYKNIMDLIQEGNIGLMQAVKRYDPYRGVKLSSYAAWWIRAYILRFILNNWRLVKLGTTQAQRKLFFNLRKKKAELVAMGIEPTDAEVAKRHNVPESDVAEMDVRLTSNEKSLDAPVGDAEGRSIAKVDLVPSMWEGPEAQM